MLFFLKHFLSSFVCVCVCVNAAMYLAVYGKQNVSLYIYEGVWGSGGMIPLGLNLSTRRISVVNFTPRPPKAQEKAWYPLNSSPGVPQGRIEGLGLQNKSDHFAILGHHAASSGKKSPLLTTTRCVMTQKSAVISYFMAGA